jgi:hypothetical protein
MEHNAIISSCDGFMHGLACKLPDSLSKYAYPGFFNYFNSTASEKFSNANQFYKQYMDEIDTIGLLDCSGGFEYEVVDGKLEINGFLFKKVNIKPSEFSLTNGLSPDRNLCALSVIDVAGGTSSFITYHFDDFFERVFNDYFDESQISQILLFYMAEQLPDFQFKRFVSVTRGGILKLEAIGMGDEDGKLVKYNESMKLELINNGLGGVPLNISGTNSSDGWELQTISKANDHIKFNFSNNSVSFVKLSGFKTSFKFFESGHKMFYLDLFLYPLENSEPLHLVYKLFK